MDKLRTVSRALRFPDLISSARLQTIPPAALPRPTAAISSKTARSFSTTTIRSKSDAADADTIASRIMHNLSSSCPPKVVSLCASVPVLKPPAFVGKLLELSCSDPESEIQFYRSRSCLGTEELQEAVKKYYKNQGLNIDKQKAIFTNSEHNIVSLFINLLKHEKSSVIMTTPTFGLFFNALYNNNIPIDIAPLTKDTDWKLTPEILRKTLQENRHARLFIFINPDNPSGKSYTKAELKVLAEEFIAHNKSLQKEGKPPLILFSDEASRRIMLDPEREEFCSIATVAPGMEDFTITVSTSSKDLSPGLAICHGMGPDWIINNLLSQDFTLLPDALAEDRHGPSYPSQVVLKGVFNDEYREEFAEHITKSLEIYRANLTLIDDSLRELNSALEEKFGQCPDGKSYIKIATMPDGGLQCMISAEGLRGMKFPPNYVHHQNPKLDHISSSFDLACYIENTAKARILHGELCGINGAEMLFRVTISKETSRMREIFANICESLKELTPQLSLENQAKAKVKSDIPSSTLDAKDFARTALNTNSQTKY